MNPEQKEVSVEAQWTIHHPFALHHPWLSSAIGATNSDEWEGRPPRSLIFDRLCVSRINHTSWLISVVFLPACEPLNIPRWANAPIFDSEDSPENLLRAIPFTSHFEWLGKPVLYPTMAINLGEPE